LGEWLFAGSIVEWQDDDAIFEIRNYINGGEKIEFLIPNSLENLPLILNEFEDADSGEITPRVSAGQGKKIRIKSNSWNKPIEQIKKLLPQYVIARKYQGLKGENQEFYEHKRDEFEQLINGCPLEE
jgi:hypothetical protein